jgi:hypothetical protein
MNKGESHGVHRADCQRSDLRIVIRPIRSRRFQSANGSAAAPLKPVITHYKRRGTNFVFFAPCFGVNQRRFVGANTDAFMRETNQNVSRRKVAKLFGL